MMAGVVIACIKFIMLFRETLLSWCSACLFSWGFCCLYLDVGKLISRRWLGALLIYFYVHNITY